MTKLKQTLEEAKSFSVTIFADEYGQLELDPRLTVKEAQAVIRNSLNLNPLRRKAGKSDGAPAIARAFKVASEEQRKEILRILQE